MNILIRDFGADVESPSADGRTILIQAAQAGKQHSVKRLLELGADPTASDWRGRTPFDWASANGHAEVADLIRNRTQADDAGQGTDIGRL